MASDAQNEANRRNARLSTGPRTAAGKAVSSQNAVRHGLLSERALVSGEDPDEYDRLERSLLETLSPVGGMELVMCQEFVDRTWRLRRAARIEAGLFDLLLAEEQKSWAQEDVSAQTHYTSPLDDLEPFGKTEILDPTEHARALERKSAASEAMRSDRAAYGRAFNQDASKSDAFTKLGRYEGQLYTSWRRCLEDLKELQRQRRLDEQLSGETKAGGDSLDNG